MMFLFLFLSWVWRWFGPEEPPPAARFAVQMPDDWEPVPVTSPLRFSGADVRVWVHPVGTEALETDGDELIYAGPDGVGSVTRLAGVKSVEFGPLPD